MANSQPQGWIRMIFYAYEIPKGQQAGSKIKKNNKIYNNKIKIIKF